MEVVSRLGDFPRVVILRVKEPEAIENGVCACWSIVNLLAL
jgi:hypothetical protein